MWQSPFNPLRAPLNKNANDLNDQIDWAELAKNWIQQKEMMGIFEEPTVEMQSTFQPENSAIDSMDPALTTVNISDMTNAESIDFSNYENYYENYETNGEGIAEDWSDSKWGFESYPDTAWMDPNFDSNNFNMTNSNNLNLPAWAVPPPPPPENQSQDQKTQSLSDIQLSMFNLANQSLIQNSVPFNMSQQRPPDFMHRPMGPGFPNMWIPMDKRMPPQAVPKLMGDVRPRIHHRLPNNWIAPNFSHGIGAVDDNFLDANRRRQLPAWIRDGLEKMEREKQKQLEKDRLKQLELETKRQKLLQQQIIDPSISKFDESDNEEEVEEGEDIDDGKDSVIAPKNESNAVTDVEEEPEELISEEEKQMRMILKVKQWMTEILLDVTNNEMLTIAEHVHRRAKSKQAKAPARQLVSSSALASLCTLGDDSENEVEPAADLTGELRSSEAETESEDEIVKREKLKCKRLQFERRMKLLEQKNYKDDLLPELDDNLNSTKSLLDEKPNNTSSSGELSNDEDDNAHHKSRNKTNKRSVTPSSDGEPMKTKSDKIKHKYHEHNNRMHKDAENMNSDKNKNMNLSQKDSKETKDKRENGKRDSLTNYNKSPEESGRKRSKDDYSSSKKHRKRSKSSERKSSKKNKDRNSNDRSDRHQENRKYRHRRDSSEDKSNLNKSRDQKSKRHRSRSR